jgi:transcriptional regulator with GAF, ATPase, and Fis domain
VIVRLKICVNGQKEREFEFNRTKISLGRSPLNDLVFNVSGVPGSLGLLDVPRENGSVKLRSTAHGCPVHLERDNGNGERHDGLSSVSMSLESGDVLVFGDDRDVTLTIVSIEPLSRLGFSYVPIAAAARPSFARLLRECSDAFPDEEVYPRLLRSLVSSLVNVQRLPLIRATLTIFRSRGEYLDDVFSLRPKEPTRGAVVVPGEVVASPCPLVQFGDERDELVRRLTDRQSLAVLKADQAYQLFLGISDGSSLEGVLTLNGDQPLSEDEESICAVWWASLLSDVQNFLVHATLSQRSRTLGEENRYFRERERRHYLFKELICESPAMKTVYDQLHQWGAIESPILIIGEAGTGKELLARALHHLGPRKDGMIMSVRCGSGSEERLDLELFGCVAHDLPDALADRKGIFELAQDGTVFLEEIDQASPHIQAKLVRMLKEGEVRRAGDTVGRPVRARLITSVHRDLDRMIEERRIRHDLYLILRDHVLEIPPLRHRREDILPLAHTFLRQYARRYDKSCHSFSEELTQRLLDQDWPGNIRELQTRIESGILRSSGDVIELEQLFI